jgi:hypothetical protein
MDIKRLDRTIGVAAQIFRATYPLSPLRASGRSSAPGPTVKATTSRCFARSPRRQLPPVSKHITCPSNPAL